METTKFCHIFQQKVNYLLKGKLVLCPLFLVGMGLLNVISILSLLP